MRSVYVQLLLCILPFFSFGQASLQGFISSEAGLAISGAEIRILDTEKRALSGQDGYFLIKNVPNGDYEVRVSARGYANENISISINQSFSELNVSLTKQALTEDVLITSLRASEKTATTYSSLDKEQIAVQNFGQDFPFLLNQLPSTVVTSDAGAGIGYTGIRIRGSDPSRVNVTINGIPYNDSESHGTFWVNLPDFASSVNSVQVQRGVGTSTNGAGAFGASINVQTNTLQAEPYVELNNSGGSFQTMKNTLSLGTGLMKSGFAFDARLSNIQSEGWVDRGSARLRSWFVSGGYYGKKAFLKANVFSGSERTFQSWWGVPQAIIDNDPEALRTHYFNNLGGTYRTVEDSINLFTSGRQYNYYTYENQVDNYSQTHYQLLYGVDLAANLNLSGAFHYTQGAGFFEEFREEDPFGAYPVLGLSELMIGNELLTTTDLIRRRWLDNDFYGGIFSLQYEPNEQINLTLGGGLNQYDGDHFGEVIWARYAGASDLGDRYYQSRSLKNDGNIYLKGFFQPLKNLTAYVDLQLRTIDYRLGDSTLRGGGTENELQSIEGDFNYLFFNPKAGITYQLTPKAQIYTSFAVANREPVRSDFVASTSTTEPLPETLYDVEAGFRLRTGKVHLSANGYYMYYQNQLVLTGALNDVGANIRQNVDVSYRAGIELEAQLAISRMLAWGLNLNLSQNKIQEVSEIIYDYATFPAGEELNVFNNSDISFSPNIIAGSQLSFLPIKDLNITLISKYVGQQFLDNTSNPNRVIDAFFVNDVRINYVLRPAFMEEISLGLLVNNVLDTEFEANGYTYSYRVGDLITENFLYPQAGRNFLVQLGLRF